MALPKERVAAKQWHYATDVQIFLCPPKTSYETVTNCCTHKNILFYVSSPNDNNHDAHVPIHTMVQVFDYPKADVSPAVHRDTRVSELTSEADRLQSDLSQANTQLAEQDAGMQEIKGRLDGAIV